MLKPSIRTLTVLLSFIAFVFSNGYGQKDSVHHRTRNVIWFTPSKADKINGVAIGPLESGLFFEKHQKVNGLTVVFIGMGLLAPLIPNAPFEEYYRDTLRSDSLVFLSLDSSIKNDDRKTIHNGLVLSLAGTGAGKINGVTLSLFCGASGMLNGLSINPLMNINQSINGVAVGAFNMAGKVRGVQIGLFNNAVNLKGMQIGLWNKSRKRSLPFFNWG